jgi:Domain of unknown function (DUF3943)
MTILNSRKTTGASGLCRSSRCRTVFPHAAIALSLTVLGTAFAAEPADTRAAKSWSVMASEAPSDAAARVTENSALDFSADVAARKSYSIPALEIFGFDFLLNQHNRRYISEEYKSNLSTIRRNLRASWVVDNDPFSTNQLGHPYQGSIYHGFARSAGLDYWEALAYTFVGSAFWEVAGETTKPSRNDQINTGVGGTFLGEALFRLSSLMLEHGGGTPPLWRKFSAAALSPSAGFNRLVFGDRLGTVFASRDPAYYSRIQIGFSGTAKNDQGTSTTKLRRNEVLTDFSIDYGLPGKPDYTYTRPFDYFNLQATASSANGFENVMTRGLLKGRDYAVGNSYRGIWGLYGSYDYIAPQIFRISTTALSLGTTVESRLSDSFAVQGSALLGVGYAAVGTTRGETSERDYHYGVAPQALVAMRLIFADTSSLDFTAREYFVSNVGAERGGHDNIVRVDASYTHRIKRRHAFTIKYLGNRRDASFPDLGSRRQTRGTIGIFYTLLGQDGFGNVEWR